MAIKAGSIAQKGRNILLDRIQTGGPGQVSIPEEKVRELGNYNSVGTVLDTPDVSYSLESLDASCELEALLVGRHAAQDPDGTEYDLNTCKPIDILGLFKPGKDAPSPYNVIGSAIAPYLMPESIEYRFGISENGQISGSLRGDSIYYNRGSAFVDEIGGTTVRTVTRRSLTTNVAELTVGPDHTFEVGDSVTVAAVGVPFNGTFTITAVTATKIRYAVTNADIAEVASTGTVTRTETVTDNVPYTLEHLAYPYEGDTTAGTRYAISVSDSAGLRYRFGVDYTETPTGAGDAKSVDIELTGTQVPPVGGTLYVAYFSDSVATVPQDAHSAESAVRPSAIRGRNVVVKIGGVVWSDVQSTSAGWRIQQDADRELGNEQVVSRDYDEADVNGTVQIKPRNPDSLFTRLKQITGVVEDYEVMGALQRAELEIEIIIYSPVDGSVLKTIYCPDAKFTLPGFNGRVQQKTLIDINWTSQSGTLIPIKGARIP